MKASVNVPVVYLLVAVALLLAILLLMIYGCTTIAEKVADHMVVRSLQHQHDIILFEGDLAAFRSCLETRGGTCSGNAVTALAGTLTSTGAAATANTPSTPTHAQLSATTGRSIDQLPTGNPAKLAKAVLEHPTLGHTVELHNAVRGHGSGSLKTEVSADRSCSRIHLPVSVSQTQDLHDKVQRATASGAWDALQKHTEQLLAQSQPGDPEHDKKAADHRKATLLKAYIEAFFHDGHILNVGITTTAAEIEAELSKHTKTACRVHNARQATGTHASSGPDGVSALSAAATDCSALANAIHGAMASASGQPQTFLKVSQTGFVSREGSFAAKVPSIGVDVDPLAPHLVTFEMSPAKPDGKFDWTALGTDLIRVVLEAIFDAHEGLPAVPNATASISDSEHEALLQPMSADMTAHLEAMTKTNSTAEITTAVLVDRVVKGIGPLSLNNKALEDMITTLITASVRKVVEKASWCWHACGLDQDVRTLAKDASEGIKAEAKKLEKDLERHAKAAAKRVCLRIHVQE